MGFRLPHYLLLSQGAPTTGPLHLRASGQFRSMWSVSMAIYSMVGSSPVPSQAPSVLLILKISPQWLVDQLFICQTPENTSPWGQILSVPPSLGKIGNHIRPYFYHPQLGMKHFTPKTFRQMLRKFDAANTWER